MCKALDGKAGSWQSPEQSFKFTLQSMYEMSSALIAHGTPHTCCCHTFTLSFQCACPAALRSGVVAMISAEDVLPEEEHMASGTMALSAAQPLPELEGFGQGEPEGGMQEGQEAEGVAALTAGVDELLPGSRMQVSGGGGT